MLIKKLLWAACSVLALTATQAGAQAREMVVGTGATYRPFEYETPQKEIVGFDVDLLRAVADAGGFKVKFVNTPWEGLFASVDKGDRDIIISGITITDKRREVLDFSNPYFMAYQTLLTQKTVAISNIKELAGKKVGVVNGSAGDTAISEEFGKTSTNIRRFDNTPLVLEELNQGGVDAAIGDVGVLAFYAKNNPDKQFKMVRDAKFKDQYLGIGVKKGNKALLDQINGGLKKVIDSGKYNEIYRKWFGADAPKLPAA